MELSYRINNTKEYNYLTLLMPDNLVSQCNFEYGDRFDIKMDKSAINISYNVDGNHRLSKNNDNLVINISGRDIDKVAFERLKSQSIKILSASIQNDKLVLDLNKLVKPKGFSFFKDKGFRIAGN